MSRALDDLEKFINKDDNYLPLIKASLIHAQFKTIHPFNDGNGRTGRMLITMYLWYKKILKMPILYILSYYHQHQKTYYARLDSYHDGNVEDWVDFFLVAVIDIAESTIKVCEKITKLRERDMTEIQKLNKTAYESTIKVLQNL